MLLRRNILNEGSLETLSKVSLTVFKNLIERLESMNKERTTIIIILVQLNTQRDSLI